MHTPRRWDTPLVERRWTVLAGLVVCLLAAFPYYESIRSANELPRLYQALAWLNDGVLYLDAPTLRGFDPGPDVSRGVGGHLFPNKPPGMSVIALAAVIAARLMEQVVGVEATLESATWWLRLLGGTLPLALLAWTSLRHEGLGVRRFWSQAGAVLLLCASTPMWSYGHLAYGNVWSAALLYWGVYNLVGSGERDRVPAPLWGGLLAGSAVLFEYIAAFAALPIAWMLLARTSAERGTRELVAACVGAAIPAAALLAYHDVAFGSPWSTGYHSAANPAFAAKHGAGLLGLVGPNMEAAEAQLWDPAAGLLWWAPGVLLGALGLARMSWGGVDEILRRRGRVMLGVFLTGVAVVVSLNFQGGWRVGPRYLVFVLPCLMPGVLYVLERDRSGAWTAAWACLVGLGAVGNVLAGTLWPHIDVAHVHAPVRELLWPLLQDGEGPVGPLSLFGIERGSAYLALGLTLAWCVAVVGGVGGYAARGGIALGGFAGGVLAACVLWTLPSPHPDASRNLGYVQTQLAVKAHGNRSRSLPESTVQVRSGADADREDARRRSGVIDRR